MRNKWIYLLVVLLLISCYSKKNKTEERAKQRVTEFVQLVLTDHWEEGEAYLSTGILNTENKEIFLSNFDSWQLKDTSKVVIEFQEVFMPEDDPKQRAMVYMTIRNVENNFSKITSLPIRFERGDWYIGG
jgi:hypothetical protein